MREVRGGSEINAKLKITALTTTPLVVIDQLTKLAVTKSLGLNESITVISGFFDLVFVKNTGAAFSLFHSGGALKTIFLIGTSVVALIVIAMFIRQAKDKLTVFCFSLIAGGATGNLIDRVRFGSVTDFLYFHIGKFYWPAFNVADSGITVGVALAFYAFYFRKDKA
jgi:signal peptidase II